jgi:hypothetical protein
VRATAAEWCRIALTWARRLAFRPWSARASHPVSAESFVIFSFGPKQDAILHDVVATEGLKASFYIENQQETYLHLLAFNTLFETALDAATSRDLIIHTAESYWRGSP